MSSPKHKAAPFTVLRWPLWMRPSAPTSKQDAAPGEDTYWAVMDDKRYGAPRTKPTTHVTSFTRICARDL
jgi:hypothetical protein